MNPEIINDIIEVKENYTYSQKEHFFENVLFSYQWWILLIITIALWMIWVIVVDRKRIKSILVIGLSASTLALLLDDIGATLGFWVYPYNLYSSLDQLYTVDIAIVPVSYMLLYQYAKSWLAYSIFLILLAFFAVFVAEPAFVKVDIFIPLQWKLWYAGPIYVVIAVVLKWLVDRLETKFL
ncbi:CBO0543 family protein [Salipaludibacillus sp. CF4.18]|uniref:CBO0543 family protein n=1 Tax=Salipaludibacillus sp. CF4.18 TaxID=3373081 RepID=UPI003EE80E19